jgi:hypothetical protein
VSKKRAQSHSANTYTPLLLNKDQPSHLIHAWHVEEGAGEATAVEELLLLRRLLTIQLQL